MGVGREANNPTLYIVEKPPRNSAGFCGGGQGLSWAVQPRKEEETSTVQLLKTSNSIDSISHSAISENVCNGTFPYRS
jgi:hypothetical protein